LNARFTVLAIAHKLASYPVTVAVTRG
jgi:hypothetical protein